MGILRIIDGSVFRCICKITSSGKTQKNSHAFFYKSRFEQNIIDYYRAIMYHRYYAPIFVLEEKYREILEMF